LRLARSGSLSTPRRLIGLNGDASLPALHAGFFGS
jgi:hypothetical protein